jgi:hypothetical protein
MAVPSETEQLIDALIGHWSWWETHEKFYLTDLAPSLVADPTKGDGREKEILGKLRQLLNEEQWRDLTEAAF